MWWHCVFTASACTVHDIVRGTKVEDLVDGKRFNSMLLLSRTWRLKELSWVVEDRRLFGLMLFYDLDRGGARCTRVSVVLARVPRVEPCSANKC